MSEQNPSDAVGAEDDPLHTIRCSSSSSNKKQRKAKPEAELESPPVILNNNNSNSSTTTTPPADIVDVVATGAPSLTTASSTGTSTNRSSNNTDSIQKKKMECEDSSGGTGSGNKSFITEDMLNPNDVLMGRGSHLVKYEGNMRFRDLVVQHQPEYIAPNVRHHVKDAIARQVLETIASRQGRFLRKVEEDDEDEDKNDLHKEGTGCISSATDAYGVDTTPSIDENKQQQQQKTHWVLAEHSIVLEKVKQAFRDRCKRGTSSSNTAAAAASLATEARAHRGAAASVAASPYHHQPQKQNGSSSSSSSIGILTDSQRLQLLMLQQQRQEQAPNHTQQELYEQLFKNHQVSSSFSNGDASSMSQGHPLFGGVHNTDPSSSMHTLNRMRVEALAELQAAKNNRMVAAASLAVHQQMAARQRDYLYAAAEVATSRTNPVDWQQNNTAATAINETNTNNLVAGGGLEVPLVSNGFGMNASAMSPLSFLQGNTDSTNGSAFSLMSHAALQEHLFRAQQQQQESFLVGNGFLDGDLYPHHLVVDPTGAAVHVPALPLSSSINTSCNASSTSAAANLLHAHIALAAASNERQTAGMIMTQNSLLSSSSSDAPAMTKQK